MAMQARSHIFWKSPRQGRRLPFWSTRAVPQSFPWKMNGQSGRRRACWRSMTAISSGVCSGSTGIFDLALFLVEFRPEGKCLLDGRVVAPLQSARSPDAPRAEEEEDDHVSDQSG